MMRERRCRGEAIAMCLKTIGFSEVATVTTDLNAWTIASPLRSNCGNRCGL